MRANEYKAQRAAQTADNAAMKREAAKQRAEVGFILNPKLKL